MLGTACRSLVVSRQVGRADRTSLPKFNAHLIADEQLDTAAAPFAEATRVTRTGARTGANGVARIIPLRERDLGDLTSPPHTREDTGSIPALPIP